MIEIFKDELKVGDSVIFASNNNLYEGEIATIEPFAPGDSDLTYKVTSKNNHVYLNSRSILNTSKLKDQVPELFI